MKRLSRYCDTMHVSVYTTAAAIINKLSIDDFDDTFYITSTTMNQVSLCWLAEMLVCTITMDLAQNPRQCAFFIRRTVHKQGTRYHVNALPQTVPDAIMFIRRERSRAVKEAAEAIPACLVES